MTAPDDADAPDASDASAPATEKARREKEVAERRWRNMMIAALANKDFTAEQKRYLEKMRKELGVSIAEAGRMVAEYREKGGGIKLFGDRAQRVEVFRDMLTMMLVDGKLDDKEKKLLNRLADKLEITTGELQRHLEECEMAVKLMGDTDSRASGRFSRRVFRRMIESAGDREALMGQFDSLEKDARRELELQVIQRLAEEQRVGEADESVRTQRHRQAYLEDQKAAKLLLENEVVAEAQCRPFRQQQEEAFQRHGRVVSFLTLMVKAGALAKREVDWARSEVRKENGTLEPTVLWRKELDYEYGSFAVVGRRATLDQTFNVGVLELHGSVDHHTSAALEEAFATLFRMEGDEGRLIVLDLTDVKYMSSAGVGVVLNNRVKALERWGDVRFINLSKETQELVNLLGVDQVLTICTDLPEALWSFVDLATARDG